jgi:hypothetical protein
MRSARKSASSISHTPPHGRDSLGDRGGIARSLGDEKGLSLVESKRHDGEDSTGWCSLHVRPDAKDSRADEEKAHLEIAP